MDSPLCVSDISLHLAETVLLCPSGPEEFILCRLQLCKAALGRMPCVVGFLALSKGRLDTADEANVLINDNAKCQDVLLGLAIVEFFDAELDVCKAF